MGFYGTCLGFYVGFFGVSGKERNPLEEGRPVPAICPRIRLRITDSEVPEDRRVAGEGSVEQIRRDMAGLEELGCQYVLLDNYYDDLEAIKNNEASWSMLAVMAEKVVDLGHETIY